MEESPPYSLGTDPTYHNRPPTPDGLRRETLEAGSRPNRHQNLQVGVQDPLPSAPLGKRKGVLTPPPVSRVTTFAGGRDVGPEESCHRSGTTRRRVTGTHHGGGSARTDTDEKRRHDDHERSGVWSRPPQTATPGTYRHGPNKVKTRSCDRNWSC